MTADAIDQLPQPVILAANPLRGLWPRSTPQLPYSFAPGRSGQSPTRILAEAFLADPAFAPPFVLVGEMALAAAIADLRPLSELGLKLIVVPCDSRNGVSAVLAALEASAGGSIRTLLFAPATLRVPDLADFTRQGAEACMAAARRNKAVMFAARAGTSKGGFHLKAGPRDAQTGYFKAEKAWARADTDEAAAAREFGELYRIAGPVAAPASLVLAQTAKVQPMLSSACANALSLADRAGWAIHPHGGFLSLAAGESIGRILVAEPEVLLIAPAPAEMQVVRGWADLSVEEAAAKRASVVTAGVTARIVEGHAGVFVFSENAAHEAESHFMAMVQSGSDAEGRRQMAWGSAELVTEEPGLRILRLEVAPHAVMAGECHFRRSESWAVVSGKGSALLDGEQRPLAPGDIVQIGRGVMHGLDNDHAEPLVIYETRAGAVLDDEDRMTLASQPARRETA